MSGQTFNNTGIDRSVGLLVMGIVVVGFLLVMIVGMDGVQRTAKSVSPEPAVEKSQAPVYDFSH